MNDRATRSDRGWLVALDRARLASALARPRPAGVLAFALPLVVVASALWTLGRAGGLQAEGAAGGLTLGLLVSGPVAFVAYGILFRAGDDGFLRRLGIAAEDRYLERSVRLLGAGLAIAAALVVPFVAAGRPLGAPLLVGVAAAIGAATTATLAYAWAAGVSARGGAGVLSVGIRQFDPGLARAAPLVYAPLLPFLAGAIAGAAAGAVDQVPRPVIAVALLALPLLLPLAARLYAPAEPRFFPRSSEMAYSPPPEGEGEAFRVGRGLSALLPRRAGAVWVRDAAVAGRRFGWAARVTWPVGIASLIALARWGEIPATRVWVVAAVGVALVIQSAAVVGLGLVERTGTRWVDRSLGIAWWERFLGRWAFGWGLSLWLLVPLALAWAWWSGVPGAWLWPVTGALTAALAVTVSLLAAPR